MASGPSFCAHLALFGMAYFLKAFPLEESGQSELDWGKRVASPGKVIVRTARPLRMTVMVLQGTCLQLAS